MKGNSVRLTWVLPLLATATIWGCGRSALTERGFDAAKRSIDTVVVLLPRIEYYEKVGKAKRAGPENAQAVTRLLASSIRQVINEGSFVPGCTALLRSQVCDSLHISDDNGITCPLSPALRSELLRGRAKYVLFVQGKAFTTPERSKQGDLLQIDSYHLFFGQPLLYEYQWNGLRVEAVLLDANSNEVIWYNKNPDSDSNVDPFDGEQIRDFCRKLLHEG